MTEEEIKQAKTYAQGATEGEIMPGEAAKWMEGQHTGLSKVLGVNNELP